MSMASSTSSVGSSPPPSWKAASTEILYSASTGDQLTWGYTFRKASWRLSTASRAATSDPSRPMSAANSRPAFEVFHSSMIPSRFRRTLSFWLIREQEAGDVGECWVATQTRRMSQRYRWVPARRTGGRGRCFVMRRVRRNRRVVQCRWGGKEGGSGACMGADEEHGSQWRVDGVGAPVFCGGQRWREQ
ncbi:hypothetical protein BVRB_9g206900 [Beta vulgaris subsp. vulgaris]|nr:hypothetical protein BVRB_9g206900 [Beta vulgaris subsp. vulgaris]